MEPIRSFQTVSSFLSLSSPSFPSFLLRFSSLFLFSFFHISLLSFCASSCCCSCGPAVFSACSRCLSYPLCAYMSPSVLPTALVCSSYRYLRPLPLRLDPRCLLLLEVTSSCQRITNQRLSSLASASRSVQSSACVLNSPSGLASAPSAWYRVLARGVPHLRRRSDLDCALPAPVPASYLGRLPHSSSVFCPHRKLGQALSLAARPSSLRRRRTGAGSSSAASNRKRVMTVIGLRASRIGPSVRALRRRYQLPPPSLAIDTSVSLSRAAAKPTRLSSCVVYLSRRHNARKEPSQSRKGKAQTLSAQGIYTNASRIPTAARCSSRTLPQCNSPDLGRHPW